MDTWSSSSTMRSSTMTCLFLLLLLGQLVTANVLNWRQAENTDKSTVLAVTAPPENSATPASGVPSGAQSVSSLSETSAPDRPVLASATNSGKETGSAASTASTPASTASNSTASGNSTLNEYNDPSFCHVDYTPGVQMNPFCQPVDNSTVDVNATYQITWDAHWFDQGSNITIYVLDINATEDGPFELLEFTEESSLTVSSALGHASFNTTSQMLNGTNATALSLFANSTRDGQPVQIDGPIFALIDKSANGTADHSNGGGSTSSKKLGEKVGIPIGLIFFLIILAVLAFFFIRHRRRNSGYASNKSHVERTSTGSTRQSGGLGRGHKRQESFHDEPTSGGVELQNRNRGLTGEDTWEWGRDSVGSPTSPTSGNQFRDELARQKTVNQR